MSIYARRFFRNYHLLSVSIYQFYDAIIAITTVTDKYHTFLPLFFNMSAVSTLFYTNQYIPSRIWLFLTF